MLRYFHRNAKGQDFVDGQPVSDTELMDACLTVRQVALIERHNNNITGEYTLVFDTERKWNGPPNFSNPLDIV